MMKPVIFCSKPETQATFSNSNLVSMEVVLPHVLEIDWQAVVGPDHRIRGLQDFYLVVEEGMFRLDPTQGGYVRADVYTFIDDRWGRFWGLGIAETHLVDSIREKVTEEINVPVLSNAFCKDGAPMITYWLDERPDISYVTPMAKLYKDPVEHSVKKISAHFRRLGRLAG
jgi:hypothetical protein